MSARRPREIGNPALTTAVLAERVCLLYGWIGVIDDDSDRAQALGQVWSEWYRAYQAAGGDGTPRHHPELSNARVKELADERRRIRADTLAAIGKLIVVEPAR